MQTPIRILNSKYELIGEIDAYETLEFVQKNNSFGDFTLSINEGVGGAELLQIGNLVYLDSERVGFIENLETSLLQQTQSFGEIVVTGRSLLYLFTQRVVLNMGVPVTQTAEQFIKLLVNNTIGQNAEAKRRIENLEVVEDKGILGNATYQFQYDYLMDAIKQIAEQCSLGLRLNYDMQRKMFVFDVVEGVDRTAEQSERPPIILAAQYENIYAQSYCQSTLDYKNTAYVVGVNSSGNEILSWVYDENVGVNRREVVLENRTVECSTIAALKEYGKVEISKTLPIESLDCKINPYQSLRFGEDFFLGDVVTVKWRDISFSKQIVEVCETFDHNAYNISCVFGKKQPDLLDKLKI